MQECGQEEEVGIQSGIAPDQADISRHTSGDEGSEKLQEPEEPDQAETGGVQDDNTDCHRLIDPETLEEEKMENTKTHDEDAPQTEEQTTPAVPSLHPLNTLVADAASEPCWYCLRSLEQDYILRAPQPDSDPLSPLPSGGQKVSYQTDPRPHFGVAWSSHSTCRPLWGSEGPSWGQRSPDDAGETHTCPHCHLGLPADTLSWHETKCLLFDGMKSSSK
ncbi:uncharacterized protein LOC133545212 [Nerophis ophidion]|uniref:uncharacterized protein LOC133545212 n=1 Tax=Nerophis ophidion TaxID=159077 RepID=UPI002AE06AB0|nr:uncharacterized protein LOC133545212 [Nerophis ophidion]